MCEPFLPEERLAKREAKFFLCWEDKNIGSFSTELFAFQSLSKLGNVCIYVELSNQSIDCVYSLPNNEWFQNLIGCTTLQLQNF